MCDSEEDSLTPPEIREAANMAVTNLLPFKSRDRYEGEYKKFIDWCTNKGTIKYSENCLLAYFQDLGERKSLWSLYSMLKSCLKIKHNVDISKFPKLLAYLKRKTEHHDPKKSQILTEEEINKFLNEACDKQYLLMKAALVIGVSGALRREELCKMLISHISFKDDIMLIDIPETKTYRSRFFVITKPEWITIVEKYIAVRRQITNENQRLFYTYRNGKCISSPVGINTLGKIPTCIAQFLNLKDPKTYTGHCFRRSSATLLANKGGDLLTIKRHGGWRSSIVAEGYIEESVRNKINVAHILSHSEPSTSTSSANTAVMMEVQPSSASCQVSSAGQLVVPGVSFAKVDNCTINIKIFNNCESP